MFRLRGGNLSADEATELTERLVDASGANLPFAQGLRAAADDIQNPHTRLGLTQLAERLEHGQPLDQALQSAGLPVPAYLPGLLQAAIRSGRLAEVLGDLANYYRISRDQWRQIWLALSYPCCLLLFLAFLTSVLLFWVVPDMSDVYREFDVELPRMTQSLIWVSTSGWKYAAGTVAGAVVIAVAVRLIGGSARWLQLMASLPGVGALLTWHGFMEFAQLLRLLLIQEIPLPEAMRLTSGAIRNANIAQVTCRLAAQVQGGTLLSDAMVWEVQVPGQLIPMIRLGEQHDELPASLQVASELLEGQIRLRSQLLMAVLPPIIFVFVAGFAISLLFSLFLPLLRLISNLT